MNLTPNDNCDNEDGYYLRSKHIRLDEDGNYVSPYIHKRIYKRKNQFACLPNELVQKVLSFLSHEELANTVRLVSKRFQSLSHYILNKAYKQIEVNLRTLKVVTEESLMHSQDDSETRCMCKLLNTLEFLHFHYTILQSTIWRHISNKYWPTCKCMYAGLILDLFIHTLYLYVKEPAVLYNQTILYDNTYPLEANKISQLIKMFVLYYERISEHPLNLNVFYCGSKILDILDCATEAKREVLYQTVNNNILTCKISYHFSNSWLVALETREERPKPWNEQMRLMYMRLRRIVVSHSEMQMENSQYNRELHLRPDPRNRPKKPVNSVYTGYGEVGDMFYYYGAMNEGAYLNKFDAFLMNANIFDENGGEERSQVPFVGLDIVVDLTCSLHLAHLTVLRSMNYTPSRGCEFVEDSQNVDNSFEMKMDFNYPGAKYPRLPANYVVHLTGRQ